MKNAMALFAVFFAVVFVGFLAKGNMLEKRYKLERELLKILREEDPENFGSIEIWEIEPSVLAGETKKPTKRQWLESIDFCDDYLSKLPAKDSIGSVRTTNRVVLAAGDYSFKLDLYSVTDSRGVDAGFDKLRYERLVDCVNKSDAP